LHVLSQEHRARGEFHLVHLAAVQGGPADVALEQHRHVVILGWSALLGSPRYAASRSSGACASDAGASEVSRKRWMSARRASAMAPSSWVDAEISSTWADISCTDADVSSADAEFSSAIAAIEAAESFTVCVT